MIAILTTVAEPTPSVRKLFAQLRQCGGRLVVVGDRRGPDRYDLEGSTFLPVGEQERLPYHLARLLPTDHYARKNLGYLWAAAAGAECLYETDDDNAPNARWRPRRLGTPAVTLRHSGWVNVYRRFTREHIWPRGFPLDEIRGAVHPAVGAGSEPGVISAPIQQGLVDLSPDVDAIWRVACDRPFYFDEGPSVHLPPGAWCPFNSQNTWWWPEAYPLLYLPTHCSFRVTDTWRSLVAQRCLWAAGRGVVFHAPDVVQERNHHSLRDDFEAEIQGYLGNGRMAEVLSGLPLEEGSGTAAENLMKCYQALVAAAFLPAEELSSVSAWIEDLNQVCRRQKQTPPAKAILEGAPHPPGPQLVSST